MKHVPFPKIKSIKDARYAARQLGIETLLYAGTVKIHGTNASIARTRHGLVAQSRNRIITPDDDNMGFAAFVERDDIQAFFMDKLTPGEVVYGEWCGPGIQAGVATAKLPEKMFVLFNTRAPGEEWLPIVGAFETLPAGVDHVWRSAHWTVDLNLETLEGLETIQKVTEEVGAHCPFAARHGVEGPGEGIVWTPPYWHTNTDLWFKTKAEAYKKLTGEKTPRAAKPGAVVDPARIAELVHDRRLAQGLEFLMEQGLPADRTSTGAFVKWVVGDVAAEEEASKVELSACGTRASRWFLQQVGP